MASIRIEVDLPCMFWSPMGTYKAAHVLDLVGEDADLASVAECLRVAREEVLAAATCKTKTSTSESPAGTGGYINDHLAG